MEFGSDDRRCTHDATGDASIWILRVFDASDRWCGVSGFLHHGRHVCGVDLSLYEQRIVDELVPDVRSPDERRGFENFEPFLRNILLASLFFFGVFFLTRLNGAFLLSDAKTIWQFIRSDILLGFVYSEAGLVKNASQLLYPGPDLTTPIVTVGLGMGLTVGLAFLVPVVIVGLAASDSRSRARVEPIRTKLRTWLGMTEPEFDAALGKMAIWPLKYPGPVELLSFLVVAATCFVFYRLTLLLIGMVIVASLKRVMKILSSSS